MQRDTITIETPEHTHVEYELAGIGSRFLAAIVDTFAQTVIILLLALIAWQLQAFRTQNEMQGIILAGVIAVSSILIIIIYYMFFELRTGGQSPGKRVTGLVVVRDDGSPIGFPESAIRNILRIVDILPTAYTVGVLAIFFNPHCKRLGDIAAGTIVVKVRQIELATDTDDALADVTGNTFYRTQNHTDHALLPRLTLHINTLSGQEWDTINRFLERRHELSQDTRREVAGRIATALWPRFPAISPGECPDPEVFLDLIAQARSERLNTNRNGLNNSDADLSLH